MNDADDWLKMVSNESPSLISPVDFCSILRGLAQSTDDYKIKLLWDGGNRREEFLSYLTFRVLGGIHHYNDAPAALSMEFAANYGGDQRLWKPCKEGDAPRCELVRSEHKATTPEDAR